MTETDLVWLSVLTFTPTAFAAVLMFFPRGREEAMRWWALLGTAVTLAVSLIVLTGYLELPGVTTPVTGGSAQLETRVDDAVKAQGVTLNNAGAGVGARPGDPADWVAR